MWSKKGVFRLNQSATEKTRHLSIFRGLIFAMLSGLCYSLVSVIVKQMKNLHPGQLAMYRFMALFVMSMPEAVKTQQNLLGPRKLRIFMVLRGIFGGINTFLNFIAFRYLELGQACVIIFSAPVFVTIFARIFLKEPCNMFQSITVLLTVIGIIFTAKLPSQMNEVTIVYSREKIIGLLAAIISLFSVSTIVLIARKVRCVHPSVLILQYSCAGTFEIAILTAVFGNFQFLQCGIQSLYILLLAVISYGGTTLFLMAIQCEYAGPVTTMRAAMDIGMAFLWQIVIFHDIPDTCGIIGAILVSVSVIFISFGKWLTTSQRNLLSCETFKCFSM